jgi:hypothetical protein
MVNVREDTPPGPASVTSMLSIGVPMPLLPASLITSRESMNRENGWAPAVVRAAPMTAVFGI